MRRDTVVQVIVDYGGGYLENFATPFEAESFINSNIDELDIPLDAWVEDMRKNVKWHYDILEDDAGVFRLVDQN